eukprot:SAG31_NODE_3128_length_4646_cov_3.749285_6_plen_82_part_00
MCRVGAARRLLFQLLAFGSMPAAGAQRSGHQLSPLVFACSDSNLTEGYAWAKKTALGYVMTGASRACICIELMISMHAVSF